MPVTILPPYVNRIVDRVKSRGLIDTAVYSAKYLLAKFEIRPSEFLFYRKSKTSRFGRTSHGIALSKEFIGRIKQAYRAAIPAESTEDRATWALIDSMRRDIRDALLADDDRAQIILSDPASTNLYYGIDNLCRAFTHTSGKGQHEMDKLIRLSEALGVRRAWNPENPALFANTEVAPELADPDEELNRISTFLGTDIKFPNPFRHAGGLVSKRGIVEYRALQAIYQAYRVRQLGGKNVLEIGGGMGRTAFYAFSFGVSKYTIVDIPLSLVGQALFLGAVLGEQSVSLYGETPRNSSIALLPSTSFPNSHFDVILNVDSLTEMSRREATEYIDRILQQTTYFLSINHEINAFTVRDLLPNPVSRHPYWMRKGYVEELFRFG